MSFFITQRGFRKRSKIFAALAGADKICQTLATAAGSTKTFHAYLSTGGPNAVNARDRIAMVPGKRQGRKIANNPADLHGDTLELARLAKSRKIFRAD